MEKIVVATKFNKTGKRVLTIPLDDRKICAPAYRLSKKARDIARVEWKRKRDSATRTYVENMANWIASYIAKDSTSTTEKYKIAKFLAEQSLAERGPMHVAGPGSNQRWSVELSNIPELSGVEEEAWEAYVVACRKADAEKEAALTKVEEDCNNMTRALAREISDHIHRQYHQEDTH